MAKETAKSNAMEIGAYGVPAIPVLNPPPVEHTVFTIGSKNWAGNVVALLHALTWILAGALTETIGNKQLNGMPNATSEAKILGSTYAWFPMFIVIAVLLHAMFAKKEEYISSAIASVILFMMVLFELSLGCVYVGYAISLGNRNLYDAAIGFQFLTCAGCAMILVFYVNFTHNGNLQRIGD